MYVYSTFDGYEHDKTAQANAKITLGNLGFNSIECEVSPLVKDEITLKCDHGLITEFYKNDTEVGYGINFAEAFIKFDHQKRLNANPVRRPNCPAHYYNDTPPEWDRNKCLRNINDEINEAMQKNVLDDNKF